MDSRVEFDVDVKPRVFSSEKVAIVAILLQEHSFFETLKNRVKTHSIRFSFNKNPL